MPCSPKLAHTNCFCASVKRLMSENEADEMIKGGQKDRCRTCLCAHTCFTLRVLQTETGLVPLSNLGPIQTQQVIVSEDLHTVVVAAHKKKSPFSKLNNKSFYLYPPLQLLFM